MVRCTLREDLGHASDHILVVTELEWQWKETPIRRRRLWKKLAEKDTASKVAKGSRALESALSRRPVGTEEEIEAFVGAIN